MIEIPNIEAAKQRLRRHFKILEDVELTGDRHTDSVALSLLGSLNDLKTERYFARFSATAFREVESFKNISSEAGNTSIRVPHHRLLEDGLLIREFVPGWTLAQIEHYYIACVELQILFEHSRGLPRDLVRELIALIFDEARSFHAFAEEALNILRKWSKFISWRDAIARHLNVPLTGEALRLPLQYMHAIHTSQFRKEVPFDIDRILFAQKFAATLQRLVGVKSSYALREMLKMAMAEIAALCRRHQLYDIHHDNILLGCDGKIYVIDLECAGLGASDRLLSEPIFFVEDLVHRFMEGEANSTAFWAGRKGFRWNVNIRLAHHRPYPPLARGFSRAILCGSSAFASIVQTVRETVFFAVVLEHHSDFVLNSEDEDIRELPAFWRDFQKLKRFVRGVSQLRETEEVEAEITELRLFLYESVKPNDNNRLTKRAERLLANLCSTRFQSSSLEYLIFMRIFEFVRLLPFEVVTGEKVNRGDIECALEAVLDRHPADVLAIQLVKTMTDLFKFSIPYHRVEFEGIYRFPENLRRRIERKIAISEKRLSKKTEYWLQQVLFMARRAQSSNKLKT
jgi:hypothetical protein